MFQFILTNILMISLGTILYLVARSLPRVSEEGLPPQKHTFLDRWVMSEMPEKLDAALNKYLGKLFRKLKISLMRLDNFLTERLKKMGSADGNGNGKAKIDFKEITASEPVAKEEPKEHTTAGI